MLDAMPRRDLISLLDEDPDLAVGVPDRELDRLRRHAVTPVIEAAPPTWDPQPINTRANPSWLGLLVLDGLVLRRVTVGKRAACELCARGDLIRPWDTDGDYAPLSVAVDWLVLTPTRLAVLDSDFATRTTPWPILHSRITSRAAQRPRYLTLIQAVTHLPRVHARLLLVFWVLAERNGRVSPRGVSVKLPVTHDVLAMLVGALRPTVTLALQRLNRADLLIRERSDQWLLTHRAIEILERPDDLDLADIPELRSDYSAEAAADVDEP